MDGEKFRDMVRSIQKNHDLQRVMWPFMGTEKNKISGNDVRIYLILQNNKLFIQFWHRIVGSYSFWWDDEEIIFKRIAKCCGHVKTDEELMTKFVDLYKIRYGSIGSLYGLR